ncbi:sugar phosphate isomerase/epimerase [Infirmifilum lucidum]|uniref:Sugar phosphate isomerase/epimerase n=1 Tax=Infirmifilum lucidum TaxID=2776706 RepID=A0A7L9FIG1_9CREN|nr:sugar phosphate isomerase/epimerase family protein [Infirmifilum lucidum]QOJ79497.1 sugar phosphate isomerase/epimerase [Infirmifilum lucidum]
MFKLSIVYTPLKAKFEAVATGAPEVVIPLLAELGYNGVEFSLLDPSELLRLASIAHDYGLQVPAVGTGLNYLHLGLDLTGPDEETRRRALERILDFIAGAYRSEAGGVIIGLIRGRGEHYSTVEEALKVLENQLQAVCKSASEHGVRVFLEPLNRYETRLINTVSEGLDFIGRLDCGSVYLLLDTFHMNIEEPVIEDSIRAAGDRIGHFHVADSNRYAPGMGHLDFSSILAALHDTGYRGFVSAEVIVKPDFEAVAKLTLNTLRVAMRGLQNL